LMSESMNRMATDSSINEQKVEAVAAAAGRGF